jgi:hypothetical protein
LNDTRPEAALDEYVRIVAPTAEGAPFTSEGLWAVPRDLAAGLYQVHSIGLFTDGVSGGDVVRCEPNGEHRLVAVEVVRRSGGVTLALSPVDAHEDTDAGERLQRLADHLRDRCEQELIVEGGMGMLAVQFDRVREDDVLAAIASFEGDGTVDDEEQRVGGWYLHTVSYPDWPVPQLLDGTDELLAATIDLVAVDWPQVGDDLAASWPPELIEHLRDVAATDPRLREALDERRYLAAVVPSIRQGLAAEVGMDRVGRQPFALFPATGDADEVAAADEVFELEWAAARGDDGAVRWCDDPETDERFRRELTTLGLDPDADPRTPSVR